MKKFKVITNIKNKFDALSRNDKEGIIVAFFVYGILTILGGLWIKNEIDWMVVSSKYKVFSSVCSGDNFKKNPPYDKKANVNSTIQFSFDRNPSREYIPGVALAKVSKPPVTALGIAPRWL